MREPGSKDTPVATRTPALASAHLPPLGVQGFLTDCEGWGTESTGLVPENPQRVMGAWGVSKGQGNRPDGELYWLHWG